MTGAELTLVLAAVGTGTAVYGAYQSGENAKDQAEAQSEFAEYNAKVASRQADAQRRANKQADIQHSRRAKIMLSKMRAQAGKSGTALDDSPLLVMEDTANQLLLERATVAAVGESKAQSFEQQSILDISRSDAFKSQGKAAYTSGLLSAGGTALMGASQLGESPADKDYRLAKKHGVI
jgi:hypothetical protein